MREQGRSGRAVKGVLKLLSNAMFLVFFGAVFSVFVTDVLDAAMQHDAVRLCKDIVLYLAGLLTFATFEVLSDD